ncbi:unnamed protein product [Ceutorhynchus assimilis]|uniref:Titin n=1 Tax=Ceutorhynchus assimilis TaxID=467358 RepID=A0A9N9MZD7_9CUCU|nr:unnamed protein product [Ceutorhynchus assimilis]
MNNSQETKEEGKLPQTTVVIEEGKIPDKIEEIPFYTVKELPEKLCISTITDEGVKKNVTQTKRVIEARKSGNKEEVTEIVTTEVEGKMPETSITVREMPRSTDSDVEELSFIVEELPVEIQETTINYRGVQKKRVEKKRTTRREKAEKQEVTQIVNVKEDGKPSKTTVLVHEEALPVEEKPITEEYPEEVQEIEVFDKGVVKKQTLRKRTIRKRKGQQRRNN